MSARSAKVRWSRRVSPGRACRLYESDARGMLDRDSVDDVGHGIYAHYCTEPWRLTDAVRASQERRANDVRLARPGPVHVR